MITWYCIGCAVSFVITAIILFSGTDDNGLSITRGDIVLFIVLTIASWFTLAIYGATSFTDSKTGSKVVYNFKRKEKNENVQ